MTMCNPLEGKRYGIEHTHDEELYDDGEWVRVDDLKSAVKFYKRYRYNRDGLYKERPEIYEDFEEEIKSGKHSCGDCGCDRWERLYERWLLKTAFKDAVEEK